MSIKSNPCINICSFIGIKGWCIGCGQTKEESNNWNNLKPLIKKKMKNKLKKRKKIMGIN